MICFVRNVIILRLNKIRAQKNEDRKKIIVFYRQSFFVTEAKKLTFEIFDIKLISMNQNYSIKNDIIIIYYYLILLCTSLIKAS